MKNVIFAVAISFFAQVAVANPIVTGLQAEDQRRLCPAAAPSADTRLIRREAAAVLEAMDLTDSGIKVLIADCGDFAVAATTMNTIIVSPALAQLTRGERMFILAHEIGHLANNDLQRWTALGEKIVAGQFDTATVDSSMSAASREAELNADAFAAKALSKLSVNPERAAFAYFQRMRLLELPSTASHPAAKQRVDMIAQLGKNS